MRLTERCHHHLEGGVSHGDIAIDATAGNGHDTVKLAELVGRDGKVIAIDLQDAAIQSTKTRLESVGFLNRCELIQNDHAAALKQLEAAYSKQASAITFNLGYLPGSDKQVQTSAENTLPALDSAMRLLKPTGLLLVTAYRGHAGGPEEAEQVALWMRTNCPKATSHEPEVSGTRIPPILWVARAG